MLLEPGRICIKKNGRDAGHRVVIIKVIDTRFVNVISAVRKKERLCNVSHLEFLNETTDINNKAQMNKDLGVEEKVPKVDRKPNKK